MTKERHRSGSPINPPPKPPPKPPSNRQVYSNGKTKETITRNDGLTEEEGLVMDALIEAWNAFVKLKVTHPSDTKDFCDGIHKCQQILGMRVLQREFPDGWPTYEK